MSIPTPLLASLQPLQTRHHIQESPSFCKPQGYLLPSQGNPKAQFLATPTTPQGSYSILLHPPQDNYTLSAKPTLPAVSPLFNPAVPACALYSPVHVPTRRPAYTCLHQPACLHQPGRSRTCHQATNLPTLSLLPSCVMACSEKEPCQPVAKPLFMNTKYEKIYKYTEGQDVYWRI